MLKSLRPSSLMNGFKVALSKRLIWRIAFIALLSVVVNAIQFYFFYSQTLDVLANQLSFQLLPDELAAVAGSMPSIYEAMSDWLVVLLVIQLTLTTIAGFWLSYRLYGPVERIRQGLVEISLGRLSKEITVRKGDELVDIAEDINDSAARLQVMVMGMKENLERLEACELLPEQAPHIEVIRSNLAYFETLELELTPRYTEKEQELEASGV